MDWATVYVIRVAGRVDPTGVAELAGLRLAAAPDGATTELVGRFADQGALLGALAPRWADRLGGLRVARLDHPAGVDAATSELRGELRGELPDQAALMGVLTTLYDLCLPLVSLACAPPECPAGDRDQPTPAPSPT